MFLHEFSSTLFKHAVTHSWLCSLNYLNRHHIHNKKKWFQQVLRFANDHVFYLTSVRKLWLSSLPLNLSPTENFMLVISSGNWVENINKQRILAQQFIQIYGSYYWCKWCNINNSIRGNTNLLLLKTSSNLNQIY